MGYPENAAALSQRVEPTATATLRSRLQNTREVLQKAHAVASDLETATGFCPPPTPATGARPDGPLNVDQLVEDIGDLSLALIRRIGILAEKL